MISASASRRGSDTEAWLKQIQTGDIYAKMEAYAKEGVAALKAATPQGEGTTAEGWTYEIKREKDKYSIIWNNTNVVDGIPIAILIQYGHGTRNGGYVQGVDYINPALAPIFKKMTDEAWRVVTRT